MLQKVAIQRQIMQNNIFPVYSPHKFRHKLFYPEPPPLPGTRSIEFHLSWSVIYPDSAARKKNRSGFRILINLIGERVLCVAQHSLKRQSCWCWCLVTWEDAATLCEYVYFVAVKSLTDWQYITCRCCLDEDIKAKKTRQHDFFGFYQ